MGCGNNAGPGPCPAWPASAAPLCVPLRTIRGDDYPQVTIIIITFFLIGCQHSLKCKKR